MAIELGRANKRQSVGGFLRGHAKVASRLLQLIGPRSVAAQVKDKAVIWPDLAFEILELFEDVGPGRRGIQQRGREVDFLVERAGAAAGTDGIQDAGRGTAPGKRSRPRGGPPLAIRDRHDDSRHRSDAGRQDSAESRGQVGAVQRGIRTATITWASLYSTGRRVP